MAHLKDYDGSKYSCSFQLVTVTLQSVHVKIEVPSEYSIVCRQKCLQF